MMTVRNCVAIGVVLLFLGTAFQPAAYGELPDGEGPSERQGRGRDEVPAPFRNMGELASKLLNTTADPTDTDKDGLPDNVELALGTDPSANDSDCDMLSDHFEIFNGLDPNNPDSNGDHMPDNVEVGNVKFDLDADGVPNAWDWDNDNDGVMDELDISPFANTVLADDFQFGINVSDKPSFITFQLRPRNPDHLRLFYQVWDWPTDLAGPYMDVDGSKNDLVIQPVLEFRTNTLPDSESAGDFGISVANGAAYIPLTPVWEFGNIVAYKGRMYYPSGAGPRNISADMSLSWKVIGTTDLSVGALKVKGTNTYLSVDSNGKVTTASQLTDKEKFAWKRTRLDDQRVTVKAHNGNYLSVDERGYLTATDALPGTESVFYPVPITNDELCLAGYNYNPLAKLNNGSVVSNFSLGGTYLTFNLIDCGVQSEEVQLASYKEAFTLTGFRVEEDFGAKAGLFYGSNRDHLIGANIMLAYDFLRNASRDLQEMPAHLTNNYSFAVSNNISSFKLYDEAICALAGGMPKDAVSKLPNGKILPIIAAIEDKNRVIDLSEISPGQYTKGKSLKADCRAEKLMTVRTVKTTWYNTSSDKPLELEDMLSEIKTWNLTDSSKISLIALVVNWGVGAQTVVSVGGVNVDFSAEYNAANINAIGVEIAQGYLDTVGELMELVEIREAKRVSKPLTTGKILKEPPTAITKVKEATKAVNGGKSLAKGLARIGTLFEVVGVVIDLILIILTVHAIGDAFGWTPTGKGVAAVTAILMALYAAALMTLAIAGGPPGALVAILIALMDIALYYILGTSGSDIVISQLVEWAIAIFSDTRVRSEVGLEIISSSTDIVDRDGNGIDVGDWIVILTSIEGNVSLTKYGKENDLTESVIVPDIQVGTNDPYYSYGYLEDWSEPTKKYERYKTTVFSENNTMVLGVQMVNYQLSVVMKADYAVFYDDRWWFFGWHSKRVAYVDSISSELSFLILDVMPESIDNFVNWTALKSNDFDGDGINTTAETITNYTKWDTDADGLGDKYELDMGTNPLLADSDGDGLSDLTEMKMRTNCTSSDTDRDGLTDYAERSGAVITFNFSGTLINYSVSSDPKLNDTDGDGVTDQMEYYCLLNPRSQDTNGDGYMDLQMDTGTTRLMFVKDIVEPLNVRWTEFLAMSPDNHIMAYQENLLVYNHSYVKYDCNGTVLGIWDAPDPLYDIHYDGEGNLYALTGANGIIKYDASMKQVANWTVPYQDNRFAIDQNAGILYLTGFGCLTLYKYDIKNNMSFIGTMPGPVYNASTDTIYHLDVDKDGNLLIPYNNSIQVLDKNGTLLAQAGRYGKTYDGEFNGLCVAARGSDGDLIGLDWENGRIQKFSTYGQFRARFGQATNASLDDYLYHGVAMTIDDTYVYVACGWLGLRNITKIQYGYPLQKVNQTTNFTDTDGDGMTDRDELAGWNVTVATNTSGRAPVTYHVTSDPNMTDTDGDGISDLDESKSVSDARRVDTDQDGVSDAIEKGQGTNISNWDTDGDRLDDGTEPTFGSDPKSKDTDGEGLDDLQEFQKGSSPTMADSDWDGLGDLNESFFGSDLSDPDSDDDFMPDSGEKDNGTDPYNADTDGDQLPDGHETLYGTDPKDNDTDGDGLADGIEVEEHLDPLCNDTDGDGLADGYEVAQGLNPFSGDSDFDGVLDGMDDDALMALDDDIILVADEDVSLDAFASDLSGGAKVIRATPQEMAGSYSGEPYIVVVGRPDAANGSAGALIRDLLAESGETYEMMLDTTMGHMAVRYGVWAPTQTVVMLSALEPYDHIEVLGILKSMKMTVQEDSVTARYLSPRTDSRLCELDVVKTTDAGIWSYLNGPATFNVTISKHNATNTPAALTYRKGLQSGDRPLERYLEVTVEGATGLMNSTLIEMYYSTADLDRNGDGDADDAEDIDESTLALYKYDEASGNWTLLSDGLDWVEGTGVNTTDFALFGTQYQGVIYANVTSLGLFGVGGKAQTTIVPTVSRAGDDRSCFEGDAVQFNGSLSTGNGPMVNYSWSFCYNNQTVALYGPQPSFVFMESGAYAVTLTVMDSLGYLANDTLLVTVSGRVLRVGPVKDINGTALGGVLVNLTIGNETFSNTTDSQGYANFRIRPGHLNRSVRLNLTKAGYQPADYMTNITAAGTLERDPPALNITALETFNLALGPVKDAAGKPVEGALVTITVGGKTYSNSTDAQGIVRFVLPLSTVGKDISVRIEKKGYTPVVYDTNITADRKLTQSPPEMKKAVQPGPQEGIPLWAVGAAAIAIIVLVLLGAILMRRKPPLPAIEGPEGEEKKSDAGGEKKSDAGEEKKSDAGEAPKEDLPSFPPIEKTKDEQPAGDAKPKDFTP